MPGTVGQSYSASIQLTNATSASIVGSLPPGINASFNSSNLKMTFSGTPTTPGTYSFNISGQNNCGAPNLTSSNSSGQYSITVNSAFTPQNALQFFYDNTTALMAREPDNTQYWSGRFRTFGTFNYFKLTYGIEEYFEPNITTIPSWGVVEYSTVTTVLAIGVGFDQYDAAPCGHAKHFYNLKWSATDTSQVTYAYPQQLVGNAVVEYGAGIAVFNTEKKLTTLQLTQVDISNGPWPGQGGEDRVVNAHLAFIPGNWQRISTTESAQVITGNGGYPPNNAAYPVVSYSQIQVQLPAYSFMIVTAASNSQIGTFSTFYQYWGIPSGCAVAYERVFDNQGGETVLDSIICNLSGSTQTVVIKLPYTVEVPAMCCGDNQEYLPATPYQSIGTKYGIQVFSAASPFNSPISVAGSPPSDPAPTCL